MKRFHLAILALFAAVLVTTAPAHAYRDTLFDVLPFTNTGVGVTTVITDTQGDIHTYDGVMDVSRLEDYADAAVRIASYSLVYEGEELLSVTLHDFEVVREPVPDGAYAGNISSELNPGFFAVEFTYQTIYEGFLTGLRSDQLEDLQTTMMDAALELRPFDLTNVGFIDAEKLSAEATYKDLDGDGKDDYIGDSNHCWAAATSNILHYTGWAKFADSRLTDEDRIMNLFNYYFTDGFSNVAYGLSWFFNGQYYPDEPDEEDTTDYTHWAHRYEDSYGNYLPDYKIYNYREDISVRNKPSAIETVAEELKEGFGVAMSLGWYNADGERGGGHAITLWGYIRLKKEGPTRDPFAKTDYIAIMTADSDTDAVYDDDNDQTNNREDAPNKMWLMPLTPTTTVYGMDSWALPTEYSGAGYTGILEKFVTLKALSRKGMPDLTAWQLYISDCAADVPFLEGVRTVFATGDEFTVSPWIWNSGEAAYNAGTVSYSVELRGETYEFATKGSGECRLGENGLEAHGDTKWVNTDRVSLGELEAGTYTVRVTLTGTTGEAYYSNNSKELTFKVVNTGYNTSGASMKISRFRPASDRKTALVDLQLTGLEGISAQHYYLSANYMMNGEWETSADSAEEPTSIKIYCYGERVRIRLLIQPQSSDMPWAALETELPIYCSYELNGAEQTLTCRYSSFYGIVVLQSEIPENNAVFVASYDEDGRMVYINKITKKGGRIQFVNFDPEIKLFWVDENSVPQCASVTIK